VQTLRFAGVVLTAAALFNGDLGFACGDKLLSIGRGIRFQHAYGARQANIVIYSQGNQSGANFTSAKLQNTLRQAGHKLQTAEGLPQLDNALKSGKVDVVLAEFADLAGITFQLQAAPSKPVILPVLSNPSKAELDAAQKDYKYALKASGDAVQYLAAINEAMKSRLKAAAKT
jgi:ABC-type amino acid transport substrate-binding protein